MNVRAYYFAFYEPSGEGFYGVFPHVEAFGYTDDGSWLFLDPRRQITQVSVLHKIEEVDEAIALRLDRADLVLRYDRRHPRTVPPLMPQTCASVCGHLVGVRAWTVGGLRKKLLQNGAEVISDGYVRRRQREREDAHGERGGESPA